MTKPEISRLLAMSDEFILTLEDAALANVNYGMSLTKESLIINRLSATVIHLYKKLNSESRYSLDEGVIAEAIQSELDWLELRQKEHERDGTYSNWGNEE